MSINVGDEVTGAVTRAVRTSGGHFVTVFVADEPTDEVETEGLSTPETPDLDSDVQRTLEDGGQPAPEDAA